MTGSFSRRRFIAMLTAAGSFGQAALAASPEASLRPIARAADFYKRAVPDAAEIIHAQKLTGRVAFALADLKTGAWLECEHEQVATPPASVTKAITALYALEALGPKHRFETRLAATGGVKNGEVQGDLVLIGCGDPTLDTDGLAGMAASLKAAGIIGVKGKLKVFENALPVVARIDPAQPDQVGYNPGVAGIALNFNRVHFEWKRADDDYTVTMDARSEKYRPDVSFAKIRIEDRVTPIYTYRDLAGQDQWTVARGALGRGGARWLPVRKPGLYAGEVFATLAGAYGIRLSKPEIIDVLPACEVLVRHQSGALSDVLRDMLRYSTNLTAEMVGLAATQKRIGNVESLQASAAEMNAWAAGALDMRVPALVDHSGLNDGSTLSALDMTRALLAVRDAGFRTMLKPFGFRDDKGTQIKDQAVAVDAKTGTLNFVSSLAGYITAQDGREMAFAIFAADVVARAGISDADREGPPGARTWNRKAKRVQQALIERWDALYARADQT